MKTSRPCSLSAASKAPTPRIGGGVGGGGLKSGPAGRRSRRGALLIETLAAALVLTFLVWATARFYQVGNAQQRLGANYSQAQTNLRTALHLMTRTIRHGNAIVASVSSGNLNGKTSSTSQVIVNTPQTTGSNIVFYVSNGTFYYQRDSDTTPTAVITGVQSLTLTYYQTTITTGTGTATTVTRTQVNSTPASATEVQITLSASYQNVTTSVTAYTSLRNMVASESF